MICPYCREVNLKINAAALRQAQGDSGKAKASPLRAGSTTYVQEPLLAFLNPVARPARTCAPAHLRVPLLH